MTALAGLPIYLDLASAMEIGEIIERKRQHCHWAKARPSGVNEPEPVWVGNSLPGAGCAGPACLLLVDQNLGAGVLFVGVLVAIGNQVRQVEPELLLLRDRPGPPRKLLARDPQPPWEGDQDFVS